MPCYNRKVRCYPPYFGLQHPKLVVQLVHGVAGHMDIDNLLGLQVLLHREREPRNNRARVDPQTAMSDTEFQRHFRFRYTTFIISFNFSNQTFYFPVKKMFKDWRIFWSQTLLLRATVVFLSPLINKLVWLSTTTVEISSSESAEYVQE